MAAHCKKGERLVVMHPATADDYVLPCIGKVFNRSKIIKCIGRNGSNVPLLEAEDAIGNRFICCVEDLKSSRFGEHLRSADCTKSLRRLSTIYHAMLHRCADPSDKAYGNYGARGISVCKEWVNNKQDFYTWALLAGYKLGMCIDRIDNDLGYYPENCRFLSKSDSARHTRNTILTKEKAESIRQEYLTCTTDKLRTLAKKYGVHPLTIWSLVRGRSWR